ncbi:MAG: hypothetical protein RQ847_00355 [Wenzhouxiangellaceae bacterium]|nr:hypothetical protein [Wenzhouxiangellaceae bacterium]
MPLIAQRILKGLTPFADPHMTPAVRSRPEKIILGVKPGHRPSAKPPVRIFLGSERKQFRAERVFLWSVEKHRDPSRIYEIHLLKGLKGYVSGFWITGFTNYRFAIPYFCDYQGRAIYNDVDQVWLTDPAELFDRDMGKAGFLSINDHDTSVMLIDCKRMTGVWSRENVVGTTRKRIEARARAAGMWGELEGRYNARDAEYVPGESACVHFTTLHTQPWRPFPDWFVYRENPTGSLWFDLEREADEARFLPISALRPSSQWPDAALEISARPDGPEMRALLGASEDGLEKVPRRRISGLLEKVPDADLPWVLDRLFRYTGELELRLAEPVVITRSSPRRNLHFWIEQLRLAGRLNPATRWRLERRVGLSRHALAGGPLRPGPVAVLAPDRGRIKAETLAGAIAERTARPVSRLPFPGTPAAAWLRAISGRGLLDPAKPPAVIVAAGAAATRAARAAARHARTPPALVLIGRRAGPVPEHAGVVVNMRHHGLPPHPNRIETLIGFGDDPEATAEPETRRWTAWLESSKRVALLLGAHPRGRWPEKSLSALLADAVEWANRRQARLLVVAFPEADAAGGWLEYNAGDDVHVYRWRENDPANPYRLALEHAGALLLAGGPPARFREALTGNRPVYIAPELTRRSLRQKFAARIARRAFRPSYNKRGSIRPQQGLTYLCARLVERGWVLPPRGLAAWQNQLVDRGLAAWIGAGAVPSGRCRPELGEVCQRIVERLEVETSADQDQRKSDRA